MAGAADTLFLPVSTGDINLVPGLWLYLGAHAPDRGFPDGLTDQLVCEQSMRGPFLDLQMGGLNVMNSISASTPFVGAFILIGKHRGENEIMLRRAGSLCQQGSMIVVAGDKTSGIASLKKRVAQNTQIEGSLAKFHATVFWLENNPGLSETSRASQVQMPEGFETAPGMFSAEKVDKGSALLANYIDKSIRSAVADFGAGWGFLSKMIVEKSGANSLDLFEAHWPSLQAAKNNLRRHDHIPINFYWRDVTREPISHRYDCIIMNPPFHTGRKSEPALGERFIEVAAKALKPNGQLLLVANVGLPYEKKLASEFSHFRELIRQDGFKVLLAEK